MKNLIIEVTENKILFLFITKTHYYTTTHLNSKENFDRFVLILSKFLKQIKVNYNQINSILINNQKNRNSSTRISISAVKAIALSKNINLYALNLRNFGSKNYKNILKLCKKKMVNKYLIKHTYSS